jgi:hypothetical protein
MVPKVLVAFAADRVVEDRRVLKRPEGTRKYVLSRKGRTSELPFAVNAVMKGLHEDRFHYRCTTAGMVPGNAPRDIRA